MSYLAFGLYYGCMDYPLELQSQSQKEDESRRQVLGRHCALHTQSHKRINPIVYEANL
ncbi:unnamed protein product [marine sediment metagenome]|uniref:Uncharacterized protein n=1 Tax=marine sediment metagenome TaxID=412755 RepID=X1VK99_9ZZZZ